MSSQPTTTHDGSHSKWKGLSLALLVIYLGFFHSIYRQDPQTVMVCGICFSIATFALCIIYRNLFLNRFEFLIHLALGVDIFAEGFILKHDHYYFYLCAIAFWSIFWSYRFLFALPPEPTAQQPATDSTWQI